MILSTDSSRTIFFIVYLCTINIKSINSSVCNRIPEGYGAPQTPADGRFHIRILENTDSYTPGYNYTIKLEGIHARSMPQGRHRFSGFILAVENESGVQDASSGVFTLIPEDTFTKITSCANMVTHKTTTTTKTEIQVLWTAPVPGSGCVAFKATVIEDRNVWYMDKGPLTKEFCEKEQIVDDSLSDPNKCCACSEAKYELTFEGLWSRNTHPKDFPNNEWITKFSDIIGASHSIDYWFWRYGDKATDGLKNVTELGDTRGLESELTEQSGHIRTIVKAKGLAYPNLAGRTTSAVFRVDRIHSLFSLVSMIDPSPDWFLGVAGVNLCLEDCTWAESRTIDLFPWDAGTDSGPSYESPNQQTNPREPIRSIRSGYPNDQSSPFYDPSGAFMKPLARLYLTRQRVYESYCPDDVDNESNAESGNSCATNSWRDVSPCNKECGKGMKQQRRNYLNEFLARQARCETKLQQRVECYGTGSTCYDRPNEMDETTESAQCELNGWSRWSECSPRCGNGTKFRTRRYKKKGNTRHCQGGEQMREDEKCFTNCSGRTEDAPNSDNAGQEPENEEAEEPCVMTEWSQFDPCSEACGGGVRSRTRDYISGKCNNTELEELKQEKQEKLCNTHKCHIPDYCFQDPVDGGCPNAIMKWFFNYNTTRCTLFSWSCGDHDNKFATYPQCIATCTGLTLEFQQRLENYYSETFQNYFEND